MLLGRLTLPNGDKLEGIFSGSWSSNVRISGHIHRTEIRPPVSRTPESPLTPLDSGWGQGFPSYKDHAKALLRFGGLAPERCYFPNCEMLCLVYFRRYNKQIMRKMSVVAGSKPLPISIHPDMKWIDIFAKCRSGLKCPNEVTFLAFVDGPAVIVVINGKDLV